MPFEHLSLWKGFHQLEQHCEARGRVFEAKKDHKKSTLAGAEWEGKRVENEVGKEVRHKVI